MILKNIINAYNGWYKSISAQVQNDSVSERMNKLIVRRQQQATNGITGILLEKKHEKDIQEYYELRLNHRKKIVEKLEKQIEETL